MVSEMVSGGEHIETYTVDLSSYNKNNLSIVAFVTYIGSTITEHEIMNVQKCDIDGFQDWDQFLTIQFYIKFIERLITNFIKNKRGDDK